LKNIFKIAFIGAGNMTSNHMKSFSSFSEFEICGIYSRTKDKAYDLSTKFSNCIVCDSIEDLYNITKPDLVVISVPELSTKSVCLEAFKYGWKILIEKPVGYNLQEAKEIFEYSLKTESTVYVAFNRRHYSSTLNLIKELNINNEPRLIHIYDQEGPIAAKKSNQPDLVLKNWMFANSIHLIDFLQFLGRGKIVEIKNILPWNDENTNFFMSKISYESGDIAIYESIWDSPAPWAIVINTKSKRYELRPIEKLFIQNEGSRLQIEIDQNKDDIEYKPGLIKQSENVLKMLKGDSHDLPNLKDALYTMTLINQIYFG
jgi:predicted dehydrogenase